MVTYGEGPGIHVDDDRGGAGHTGLAEATGDDGCVAGHAAVRGKNALGDQHAVDVVRCGLVADQHDLLALLAAGCGGVGVEDDLSNGGAGRGGQALSERLGGVGRIDRRVQQLVELRRFDALQRLVLGDQALVHHVGRDLQRGGCGALAVARLQHEQLAVLDGELEILHVLVVDLEPLHSVEQFVVGLGQDGLHLGQVVRGPDAGHHVLALRIHQELAVKAALAGGRVAGEADAGGRGVAPVTEDHLHDVDGGAQAGRDVVGPAVDLGAGVAPAAEDRVDRTVELLHRVGRPVAAERLVGDLLELGNQFLQVFGAQVGVARDALLGLLRAQRVLVQVLRDTLDNLAVHLDEAAVAVPREAFVVGLGGNRLDGLVRDTEVEDGVHHAGHRNHGTRAD